MSSGQERQSGATGTTSGYESPSSGSQAPMSSMPSSGYQVAGRHGEHRGAVVGFTALGAAFMVLGGLWSVGVGIAGIVRGGATYFAVGSNYYYHFNTSGWGWTHLILGALIVLVGVSVFLGQEWARITGVVLVALDALANFFFIPYYPLWSIIVIVIDCFIMWALLYPRARTETF